MEWLDKIECPSCSLAQPRITQVNNKLRIAGILTINQSGANIGLPGKWFPICSVQGGFGTDGIYTVSYGGITFAGTPGTFPIAIEYDTVASF